MCGIVGIWDRERSVDPAVLARMRDRIVHRGPDSDGLRISPSGRVGLGFRRLSIIDLSEAGNQPMENEAGTLAIVFNGEVFNHVALRRELESRGHRFASHSDAEVVLHAYEEYGPAALERFHGMFAFAITDLRNDELFIARDRFGIKPLYYYNDNGRFIFASEIKAIIEHPFVSRSIDPNALGDYLTYGYVPGDRAIFSGMHKLPAAHFLRVTPAGLGAHEYWRLEYNPRQRGEGELLDDLRAKLAEAVELWTVSDVPVGIFLSGGLDSSAVCALASRGRSDPPSTFSIGFDYEKKTELGYARIVADTFGTDHNEKMVRVADAGSLLGILGEVYDEPFYDTSSVPTYYVAQFAREQVKVVLAGDGGDELFFGYSWYKNFLELSGAAAARMPMPRRAIGGMIDLVRRLPGAARVSALDRHITRDPVQRYFRQIGFFDEWEKSRLLPGYRSGGDPLWLFRKHFRADLPPVTALRLLDIGTYLVEDILTKVDRATMANSLEARPPLLEHALAEFVMTIPEEQIYRNGEKKFLFKKAMEGTLPNEIIYRGKQGFSAPVRYWLRGDLAGVIETRLIGGYAVRDGVFDPGAIRAMLGNFTENRWAKIWSLLMFEGWYRRWIHNQTDITAVESSAGIALQ